MLAHHDIACSRTTGRCNNPAAAAASASSCRSPATFSAQGPSRHIVLLPPASSSHVHDCLGRGQFQLRRHAACYTAAQEGQQTSDKLQQDIGPAPIWQTSQPPKSIDNWLQSSQDNGDAMQADNERPLSNSMSTILSNEAYSQKLTALQQSGRSDRSLAVQSVQWYPGHIARAERQLKEQLKMVDVVLEVRDARIPVATHHPQVAKWVGPKPRLLVINRQDQISDADRKAWVDFYKKSGQQVFWTHGKLGDGVKALKQKLAATSEEINTKRAKRGLQPRPIRACVIGFPNIGKSALINRLIGRKAVASAPRPGVTRALQWVRLTGQLDLLDAPGVIPASFSDQVAAQRLAVCNDIGEASYIDSLIAAAFVVRCKLLPSGPKLMQILMQRYGTDPTECTAEEFVLAVADKMFFGDVEKAGARILKDYRSGFLGQFALELPEDIDEKRQREIEQAAAALRAEAERKSRKDDF